MNKNLFKTFAIAAMAVLAGACAKEQVGPSDGETTEVSFNVEVPGVSVATKGISDAASVDELVFQALLQHKYTDPETNKHVTEYIPVPELTKVVPVVDKKASITASLVKGQFYQFIFWAQKKGTGYYNVNTEELSNIDLRTITLDYTNVKTNDEFLDAFYAVEGPMKGGELSSDVKLKRALAQINFGSEKSNRQDAKISKASITLKNVPTTFYPLLAGTRSACGNISEQDIVLFDNDVMSEPLSVNSVNYDYLATTYVFAPKKDQILVDASATFNFESGRTITVKAPNAPVKQNFRTNIIGNLLLANAEWNVTIDPDFLIGDIAYDAVSAGLAKGTTVTLSEDYKVLKDNWAGINIPAGVESVLNLNGHRFANEDNGKTADAKSALVVKGKLTINGDGDVFCEGNTERKPDVEKQPSNTCISVLEGGHLIINGGNYSVGTDVDNKCNSTIYVENVGKAGKVEIYGGTFTNAQGSNGHSFVLNQDDQLTEKCITVYGGTFIGFNPADNSSDGEHTNYVAEGYKSVKISESPETWKVEKIPAVTTQAGLNDAIADVAEGSTATVNLGAGEFTTYDNTSLKGKNVTVSYVGAGADKTTFAVGTDNHTDGEANGDYSLDGVTKASFKNMTIKVDNDNYRGYIRVKELEFENCVFENRISYWGVGKVTFKNCTFNQTAEDYNLWTYSGKDFLFDGCVFNSPGKCINAYKSEPVEYTITIKDCTFNSSKENKSVVELKYNGGKKYSLKLEGTNNCTNFSVSEKTGSKLYNCNLIDKDHPESGYEQDSIVYIDGKKVWENGAKVE